MPFSSPSSPPKKKKTHTRMGHSALHGTDRVIPGFFWLHANSVRLHFDVRKHGIQWTDQSVDEALPQVSCPELEKTILKTRIVQLLETLLTNIFHIWQQTLPQNCQSPHKHVPITQNMWHTAIPNAGTAVRKPTTQEQNQNSCRFHEWFMGTWFWRRHLRMM